MFDFDVRSGERPRLASPRLALAAAVAPTTAVTSPPPMPPVLHEAPSETGATMADLHVKFFRELAGQPIARVPRRPPVWLSVSATMEEALSAMIEGHATSALVSSSGRAVGTIDLSDVLPDVLRLLLDTQRWRPGSREATGPGRIWQLWKAPSPDRILRDDQPVTAALRLLAVSDALAIPIATPAGELYDLIEPRTLLTWLGAIPAAQTAAAEAAPDPSKPAQP